MPNFTEKPTGKLKKKKHEKSKGDIDWRTMRRYRRKPAEKQQQESLPAYERTDKLETRENYYRTKQENVSQKNKIFWRGGQSTVLNCIHTTTGDSKVLDIPPPTNNDSYPILWEDVEAAVKSLKKGKSTWVDNIPSELVQAGKAMIDTHHLQ